MATQTAPGDWWTETDETLATVVELLETNAEEVRKASRGRKR